MPVYSFSKQFDYFFGRINPSPSYVEAASDAHAKVRDQIEDRQSPCADLKTETFLQGSFRRPSASFRRHTAIHSINDVDVVALTLVRRPDLANRATRDQIFDLIKSAIESRTAFAGKVRYGPNSMCLKLDVGSVTIEVLPALRYSGKSPADEPFLIFDPRINPPQWRPAFARHHQQCLTEKNRTSSGIFIPCVKVFKHILSQQNNFSKDDVVSFHIECFLHALKSSVFTGGPAEYIESVLGAVTGFTPQKAASSGVRLPTRDRLLFSDQEWAISRYERFHEESRKWLAMCGRANRAATEDEAVQWWQFLLGKSFFPAEVS